jgi:hypothetical protein
MIKKLSIQFLFLLVLAVPVFLTGCHGSEPSAPRKEAASGKTVPASAVMTVMMLDKGGVEYLAVPQTALFRKGALVGVLAVNADGRVESRWVRTGHTVGSDVIVLAGLERDSQIVGAYDPALEGGVFVKQIQAAAEEVQTHE